MSFVVPPLKTRGFLYSLAKRILRAAGRAAGKGFRKLFK